MEAKIVNTIGKKDIGRISQANVNISNLSYHESNPYSGCYISQVENIRCDRTDRHVQHATQQG